MAKRFKVIATRDRPDGFREVVDLWLPSARVKLTDGVWNSLNEELVTICADRFSRKTGIKLAPSEKREIWITVEEG